jgi:mycothiol system anti-sigma-R factor
MKDCGDYRENILLYLDKELRVSQIIELRAHLEVCETCRQVLEAEEALSHLLHRSSPLYSAPVSLRDRIRRAIERPEIAQAHDFLERATEPVNAR